MTQEDRYKITSNDYFDLLIEYDRNERLLEKFKSYSVQIMNNRFAVVYIPASLITDSSIGLYGYGAFPSCYNLDTSLSLEASGVNRIRNIPSLATSGKGVLFGIVDTGIDYTHPAFLNKEGKSKIISIWDQTIDSENSYPGGGVYGEGVAYGEPTYFGTEFNHDQINQALASSNPFDIVPSKDEIGHGTMLAGIAAGSEVKDMDFSGVATDAELVIVKLKPAKTNLKNFFMIPPGIPCYQENDIMWGLQYLARTARKLNQPIAICIGLGSSQGSHNGRGALSSQLSVASYFPGVCITVAGGNEGNNRRHFYGSIDPQIGYSSVELNVGENEPGFSMEIWGEKPVFYSIDIQSPSGEHINKIESSLTLHKEVSFVFESTIIFVDYQAIEAKSGDFLILLRFKKPSSGIWRFNVYGSGDLPGHYHIWLPSDNLITNDTYFTDANPYTTITSPGNSIIPITTTTYNTDNNKLYQNAGRGYSAIGTIKPELAAPGVNIHAPSLNHSYSDVTGSSASAAHTAGITALLLEWGIINGNVPNMTTIEIKKFLIRGASRNDILLYPNRDWGYGIVNIYNSFNILKTVT